MTTSVAEARTDLIGKVTVADVPGVGSVWLYVIAALPAGQAFGVTLGTFLGTRPAESDVRLATGTVDPWAIVHDIEVLTSRYADVLDALRTFLRGSGLPVPGDTPEPPTGVSEPPSAEALAAAKAEGRAEATREFEAWKRATNESAIEYANDNGLCSVFDEFMESVGLEPRERESEYDVSFTVTYSGSVTVTATSEDSAADMVAENLYNFWNPRYDTPDDIDITDVDYA